MPERPSPSAGESPAVTEQPHPALGSGAELEGDFTAWFERLTPQKSFPGGRVRSTADRIRLARDAMRSLERFEFERALHDFAQAGVEPPREEFIRVGQRALASGGAVTAFDAFSVVGDLARLEKLRPLLRHRPDVRALLERRLTELGGEVASTASRAGDDVRRMFDAR